MCIYFAQVAVLRSYDTMIATARRQAEGSLIYIIDKADLYLRVRDGVRQVMVQLSSFHSEFFLLCAVENGQNNIAITLIHRRQHARLSQRVWIK